MPWLALQDVLVSDLHQQSPFTSNCHPGQQVCDELLFLTRMCLIPREFRDGGEGITFGNDHGREERSKHENQINLSEKPSSATS